MGKRRNQRIALIFGLSCTGRARADLSGFRAFSNTVQTSGAAQQHSKKYYQLGPHQLHTVLGYFEARSALQEALQFAITIQPM